MIIRNINGAVIAHSDEKTLRRAAEYCVMQNMDLSGADFRGGRLRGAALDGMRGKDACFWSADLTNSDLGLADLRGAYFSSTILEGAVLDGAKISCPSFWSCDLQNIKSMHGLIYSHRGEVDISLNRPPLVVRGLPQRLVLLPGFCLWGSWIYPAGDMPADLRHALKSAGASMTDMLRRSVRNAKPHIPKINGAEAAF